MSLSSLATHMRAVPYDHIQRRYDVKENQKMEATKDPKLAYKTTSTITNYILMDHNNVHDTKNSIKPTRENLTDQL